VSKGLQLTWRKLRDPLYVGLSRRKWGLRS